MEPLTTPAVSAEADAYLLASTIVSPDEHIKIALDATRIAAAADDSAAPSLSPQNPRRILVIVSNVASGLEQAAILVIKPRNRDPTTASLVATIPILPDIETRLHQHPVEADAAQRASPPSALASLLPTSRSLPSIQAILDALSQPGFLPGALPSGSAPTRSNAQLAFTITCAGQSVSAATSDTQGLKDFLSVLRDLTKVAQQHSFSLATSHRWLGEYNDDLFSAPDHASSSGETPAVPIFERFSRSAFAPAQAGGERLSRPPSPSKDEVRISVGTFNVAGCWPPQDAETMRGMKQWIRPDEEPDILVLGFQEVDTSGGAYLYRSPAREEAWTRLVVQALGRRADQYTKIASKQLVGLLILVFARTTLDGISEVGTASVGVGLGGFVANKGAVGVRMRVGRRTFCFVNTHLSAFEGLQAMERRCWDWSEIYRRMRFEMPRSAVDGVGQLADDGVVHGQAADLGGRDADGAVGGDTAASCPPPPSPPAAVQEASQQDNDLAAPAADTTPEVAQPTSSSASVTGTSGFLTHPRAEATSGLTPIDVERSDVAARSPREENAAIDDDDDIVRGGAEGEGSHGVTSAAWTPADEVEVVQHSIRDHDLIINLGDLNFRLDLEYSEVHRLILAQDWPLLARYDELNQLRTSASLFDDFKEGKVDFAPTYKFDRGSERFDSSEKRRRPAWTDRVLWCVTTPVGSVGSEGETEEGEGKEGEREDGVVLQRYESVPTLRFSDHRPVRATFLAKLF